MWFETLIQVAVFATIVGVFLTIAAWINGRRTTRVIKEILTEMDKRAEERHREAEQQAEKRHKETEQQAEERHKEIKEILNRLIQISTENLEVSRENLEISRENQKILKNIEEKIK